MADQNTSLPVRSQADGTDERLHVKIVDGTNSPAVNQTEVDVDNNLHVELHGNDPGGVDRVVRTSETGAITPDGVYDGANNTLPGNVGIIGTQRSSAPTEAGQLQRLSADHPDSDAVDPADVIALDSNSFSMGFNDTAWERNRSHQNRSNVAAEGVYDAGTNDEPNSAGVIASTRTATPGVATQTERVTSIQNGAGTVRALDVSLHDEAGEAFSSSNPIPVVVVESEGVEINDYKAATTIAANATDNHDYTVTALKTLMLTQIEATASGKAKVIISVETGVASGTFTPKWVLFNSTANPNMSLILKEPISVAAGVRVRVAATNKDLLAQDLYSTISGHEV